MVAICNSTCASVFANLYKMQQSGEYCDVEITTGSGDKFLAHSCVLAASSPKFAAILKKVGACENMKKILVEKKIDGPVFQLLLHAIYNCRFVYGDVTAHITELENILPSPLPQNVNLDNFIKTASNYFSINVAGHYKKDEILKAVKPPLRRSRRRILKKSKEIKKKITCMEDKQDKAHEQNIQVEGECPVEGGGAGGSSFGLPSDAKKVVSPRKCRIKTHPETFSCAICCKTYRLRSTWQQHAKQCGSNKPRRHALTSQRSSCKVCGKSFTNSYVMQLHQRTHTGEELYSCDICEKKFPYKSSLSTHRLIHSGVKAYICSVCGKSFTQKIHAKEHESQHTGFKRFSCTECDKHFAHKSGLVRHVTDIHQQSRPFVCEVCGRSFPRKNKLIEHCRIHTGERPYICDVCGSSYKANRSLKLHKRSQHGIIVPNYQVGISSRRECGIESPPDQVPSVCHLMTSCPIIPEPSLTATSPPSIHVTTSQLVFTRPGQPLHGASSGLAVSPSTALAGVVPSTPQIHTMTSHPLPIHLNNFHMRSHEILYQPEMSDIPRMSCNISQAQPLPSIGTYEMPLMMQQNYVMQQHPTDLQGLDCEE